MNVTNEKQLKRVALYDFLSIKGTVYNAIYPNSIPIFSLKERERPTEGEELALAVAFHSARKGIALWLHLGFALSC